MVKTNNPETEISFRDQDFFINLSEMTNKIIVDGWNLAWKIPQIAAHIPEDLERARLQLNILLQIHFQGRNIRFRVIYDGKPGIPQHQGYDHNVDTKFSRDPEKADHLIIKFIRQQKNPGHWTVITSDRELSVKVSNLGAQVMDAGSFVHKLKKSVPDRQEIPSKTDPNLKPDELDFWLKAFKKE